MVDSSGVILGYYTLSAYAVRLQELPEQLARKLPGIPSCRLRWWGGWLSAQIAEGTWAVCY